MSDNLTSGIALAPLSVDIRANVAAFQTDMQSATAIGIAESDKLSRSLTNMGKVGDTISGIGSKLTTGISLPLAAIGVAATKVGMDFESQMSRVKAISGATGVEFDKLNDQAIELGASTAFSAIEAAQGMENLASAGFSVSEIMSAMPGMMDLAASSGEDLASSADIAASTLRGFGLEASQAAHVADVLAKNSADTNAAVADTGDAMKYVAPVAHAMGLSLEEVTASIGLMANAGIKGSQAGTTLRTALTRLADPSKEARKAMEGLKFSAFDAQGNLLPLKEIISKLKDSTRDLTMEQKQQAVSTIFGTEAMSGMLTLVGEGPEALETLTTSLKESGGAANDMAKTMQDNAKSSVEQMMGSLETAGIKIEQSIAPAITKVANYVGELADKFANLTEEQQMNILKWGAMAIAVGPVLSALGGGISTVAKLGKGVMALSTMMKGASVATGALGATSAAAGGAAGIGGMTASMGGAILTCAPLALGVAAVAAAIFVAHENSEYLSTSLSTTTEELSFVEKAINDLRGGTIKSAEEMEKLGLKYHEWSSDIAPDVVESIDDTAKAWQELNFQVDRLKVNEIAIDQKVADTLKAQTAKICDGIIQEIKDNQSESTKELSEFFNVDGVLDGYESTVLGFFDSNGQKQAAIVKEYRDKINAIYQKAADEHRGIAESEYLAIEEYEKKINQVKIDSLSTTNEEYQELQANFNVKMRSLDLEGASSLLQEKAAKREEDLAATREYYDTKIELLSMNLNNMNEPQRLAAEKELADLRAEKDKKIGIITDTYKEYLTTIEEKYPEIYDRIDTETGKILDVTEKAERQRVIDAATALEGIQDITESGMQKLYNTTTQTYDDVYVKIDESTGKIVGVWNKTTGDITGNNQTIRDELNQTSMAYNNFTISQKNDLLACIRTNLDYSGSTQIAAGIAIGALQGTGQWVNNLYTEVVNCNGTPVRVQVNKDGTIANIDEIINKIYQIPDYKYMSVWVTYKNLETGETFKGNSQYSNGYGYDSNGNPINYNYNGQDYVPYDGYTARLHEGERVLTAKENEQYSKTTNNTGISLNIKTFVNNRKQDVKAFAEELEFYRQQVASGGGKA